MDLRMRLPGPIMLHALDSIDGVELRPARLDDANELAQLLDTTFPGWQWAHEKVVADLLDAPDVPCTWLAIIDGTIAGTASEQIAIEGTATIGVVYWVGVADRYRGRGLGRFLTEAVLVGLARRGVDSARLDTQDERHPAIAMYASLGFVPDVRSPDELAGWSATMRAIASSRR